MENKNIETTKVVNEQTPAASEEDKGASVVGEVKVSNNLLPSFFGPKVLPKAKDVQKHEPSPSAYTYDYDVIIIGGGPGGYSAAETAAKYGFKTALVEKKELGGVCLNEGCIPTKTLLKTAKLHDYVANLKEYGLEVNNEVKINWNVMQERRQNIIGTLVNNVKKLMEFNKVNVIKGYAEFIDKYSIKVNGKTLHAKHFIISTGSSPRILPIPGFEEEYKNGNLIDSSKILSLDKLPKTLTIIGGGVIGIEMASLYAELGSKVTILENSPQILSVLDQSLIDEISKILVDKKIKIFTNAQINSMSGKKISYTVDGKEHVIESEINLISVGRVPNVNAVKKLNLDISPKGAIEINEFCQTSIPNIYAIGDVVGKSMLAHTAYKHAWISLSHLKGFPRKIHYDRIPACIYTHPEVATIGLTEKQAKEANKSFFAIKWPMTAIGKSYADGDVRGFIKLLVDNKYGEIIGCHIIGGPATDMIAEIATVMELEGTVFELANSVHPHPTFSEIIYDAAKEAVFRFQK